MGRIDYESETLIAHALKAEGHDASEYGTGRGTTLVATFNKRSITSPHNRDACDPTKPVPTMHAHPAAIAYGIHSDAIDRSGEGAAGNAAERAGLGISEELSPCINAKRPNAVASTGVRRLTPTECERLQGFPDDFTLIPGAADSPRYRALGNSMAVPVLRWIGKRMELTHA